MIFLFTDFSTRDPYVGQMHAAIRRRVDVPVIDLLHNVPNHDMRAGAYLLDALQRGYPPGDVFICVVDPGVGGAREPVMVKADGKWYVGPDNGLFEMVRRRARSVEAYRIDWRPEFLSASFHGRDLFSPVGAMLAAGELPAYSGCTLRDMESWPDDLNEVIYVDHFGNAITGYRGESVSDGALVRINGRRLARGETFSSVEPGQPLWYRNSVDLVEIAVREGSAVEQLELAIGDSFDITDYEALAGTPP